MDQRRAIYVYLVFLWNQSIGLIEGVVSMNMAANLRSLRAGEFDRWVEYCNSPETGPLNAEEGDETATGQGKRMEPRR